VAAATAYRFNKGMICEAVERDARDRSVCGDEETPSSSKMKKKNRDFKS
jgi:hypothetical protein